MTRPRWILKRLIGVTPILIVFSALLIWAIRPSPYCDWLGAAGSGHVGSPLSIVRSWADGNLAPRTPIGLITFFSPEELGTLFALLTALTVLLILLPAQWRSPGSRGWGTRSISSLRFPRIRLRVRTSMALIAIVGVALGWEIVSWRNWKLKDRYLGQARAFGEKEALWTEMVRRMDAGLARLAADDPSSPDRAWTPAARAAKRDYLRDRMRREAAYAAFLAASYGELRRKYERSIADLSTPVPPDPPISDEFPRSDPGEFLAPGKYARALAGFDDLIRRYPDLAWAHQRRAWILATCPDAGLRDGRRAVAAATRAAELTNWKDHGALMDLAAACAEAGDFAAAVRWEQRGQELWRASRKACPPSRDADRVVPEVDRLALYRAGRPYRMTR